MPTLSPGGKYCMYLRRSRADEDAERMGAGETLTRHQTMLQELAPTVRNVLDAYSAAETPGEQNALLKSVISRIVYYKRDTVAPGQSPADAITLDIFPLLPSE